MHLRYTLLLALPPSHLSNPSWADITLERIFKFSLHSWWMPSQLLRERRSNKKTWWV